MVELTVALIVIVVLLAGLIQIGQLTAAHTQTMVNARAAAAQSVMAVNYTAPMGANYIYTWMAGTDNKAYTRDDKPFVMTNAADDTRTIVNMARPDVLQTYRPNNALLAEGMSADPMDEFFLIRGDDAEPCSVHPVIRDLALIEIPQIGDDEISDAQGGSVLPDKYLTYDPGPTISVSSAVWMVWTEGIY
jgi:hypothetical protein